MPAIGTRIEDQKKRKEEARKRRRRKKKKEKEEGTEKEKNEGKRREGKDGPELGRGLHVLAHVPDLHVLLKDLQRAQRR